MWSLWRSRLGGIRTHMPSHEGVTIDLLAWGAIETTENNDFSVIYRHKYLERDFNCTFKSEIQNDQKSLQV